ncbi:retron system putative HNH endonuclease [Aliarcobacter cryaerophilus]|uniref:retron system putative HNH endonuclease n=1 Tax=Aliarcobacter cryaerophilus TaxID=28198 RepID=UPI003DA65167
MKHIIKQSEPIELIEFKAASNPPDWIPSYSNLTKAAKDATKKALMEEQGYICCYCERRLEENDSHIEHFQPQSDSNVDDIDFYNMLCSCQKTLKSGEPRHCGNLKGDWFDATLLISPFDSSSESKFGFKADGTIYPKINANDAQTTIEKLGLDIPKLNNLRKTVIEAFLDDSLNEDEMKTFIKSHLQRDSSGKFGEFHTTIKYIFGDLAA